MGAPQTKAQNFVLGSGYIYFDQEDAVGDLTGMRYIGDTPNMSVTVTPEQIEVYDSDGPIAEKVIDITTRIERSGTLNVRDIDDDNLASFSLARAGRMFPSSRSSSVEISTSCDASTCPSAFASRPFARSKSPIPSARMRILSS